MRRKYHCRDGLFSEQTESGMYWLGFCEADGHVHGKEVQVQLGASDRDHLERFRLALETDRPIYDYWNRKYPKSSLYVTSQPLAETLLGFSPKTVIECREELKNHLIRGLFDGDGSVSCGTYYDKANRCQVEKQRISLLGTPDLLDAVRREVVRLAGTTEGSICQLRGISEWSLSGRGNFEKFAAWLYRDSTVFLPRKRERFGSKEPACPR